MWTVVPGLLVVNNVFHVKRSVEYRIIRTWFTAVSTSKPNPLEPQLGLLTTGTGAVVPEPAVSRLSCVSLARKATVAVAVAEFVVVTT